MLVLTWVEPPKFGLLFQRLKLCYNIAASAKDVTAISHNLNDPTLQITPTMVNLFCQVSHLRNT